MTHILHRSANAVMPVAVAGSGVEIVDAEGNRYLDASGGAAVSGLGHGHPDGLAALRRQRTPRARHRKSTDPSKSAHSPGARGNTAYPASTG